MQRVIGAIILLFGIIAFGLAVSNMPWGVSLAFQIGRLVPSGVVIIAGLVVFTSRRKKRS